MATPTMTRPEVRPEAKPEFKETFELRQPRYPFWPSQAAGLISIVSGGLGIVAGFLGLVMQTNLALVGTLALIGGYAAMAIGVVAIIGGIFTLLRRTWVLALIGSIASTVLAVPFGALSLIFVTMARKDFERDQTQQTPK